MESISCIRLPALLLSSLGIRLITKALKTGEAMFIRAFLKTYITDAMKNVGEKGRTKSKMIAET